MMLGDAVVRPHPPLGLGWVCDPRCEALPSHGPLRRPGLQLVELVRPPGLSRPSHGSPDQPTAPALRPRLVPFASLDNRLSLADGDRPYSEKV
jgi:hypothetical protein